MVNSEPPKYDWTGVIDDGDYGDAATEPRPGVDRATSAADEIVRVYVKAWHEPAAEYANVPPGDLIPVVFDEPSDDVLLPRLAWMRREDVIFDAEVGRLRADLATAQQRITGVRAIHSPSRPTWNQPVDWCAGCGHDYPCPTIAALSTGGADRTGGDEQ